MKDRRLYAATLLILVSILFPMTAFSVAGNTTLSGTTGYIVVPSASPVDTPVNPAVTTGYTALLSFSDGLAHIPFLQIGFLDDFEASLAIDIGKDIDLLLNAKWRFLQRETTDFALLINGQALSLDGTITFAGQTGFAATFDSMLIDSPATTTVYLGYTFDDTLNTDIDFAMAFETPLFADSLGEMLALVIDFGNVSYSAAPSGGDASNRGLLNAGLRFLPKEFITDTYFMADLKVLDIFDDSGRAASVGVNISFRP